MDKRLLAEQMVELMEQPAWLEIHSWLKNRAEQARVELSVNRFNSLQEVMLLQERIRLVSELDGHIKSIARNA